MTKSKKQKDVSSSPFLSDVELKTYLENRELNLAFETDHARNKNQPVQVYLEQAESNQNLLNKL